VKFVKNSINKLIIFVFSKVYTEHYSVVNSKFLNPYQKSKILFSFPRNQNKYYTNKIKEFKYLVDISEYGGIAFLFNVKHVFKYHCYLLENFIKNDDLVFDIGANIGIFSLYSAYYGATVHGFEPEQKNYLNYVLNKNINSFKNIIINKKAVGNKSGSTVLYLNESNAGTHTTVRNEIIYDDNSYGISVNKSEIREEVVEIIKLDDYEKINERIKLIKIDTEGNEIDVLLGMKNLMKINPPSLIMIEDRAGVERHKNKHREFDKILSSYGYHIYYFTETSLSMNKSDRVNMSDVLFVHKNFKEFNYKL